MGLFSLIGGIIGGNKQAKATRQAADLQYQAAMAGVDETRRQFDLTRGDFSSEQQAGEDALAGMRALLGLDGAEAQQGEIDALRGSPLYQSLYGNGRDSMLANASATGGLRGGNTQGALYRLGEDTLSSVIASQLANYGGLVGIGTGADGSVGNFGANAVSQQAALRNQGAGAQAQSALIRGGIGAANWQNAGGMINNSLGSLVRESDSGFARTLGKFF